MSSEIIDLDDYKVATELQLQWDKEDNDLEIARKLQEQFDSEMVSLVSDSEENSYDPPVRQAPKLELKSEPTEESSRTYNSHQMSSASSVSNSKKFYNDELGQFINLGNDTDWSEISLLPKTQQLFDKLSKTYFDGVAASYTITWCSDVNIMEKQAFRIRPDEQTILLNEHSLLLRPRVELLSVMVHILIHIFIWRSRKAHSERKSITDHDGNFRKLMLHFNKFWRININMNHTYSNDAREFKSQWYRCRGTCLHYSFNGVARSSSGMPGIENEFFKNHQERCGGTFFKVYQVYRTQPDGTIDYRYINHIRLMEPKAELTKHLKTNIQARVMIDLTEDHPGVCNTINLTETIDLDETVVENSNENTLLADEFISNFNRKYKNSESEIKCPFCETQIKQKLFVMHLDGCMGVSQVVEFQFGAKKRYLSPPAYPKRFKSE